MRRLSLSPDRMDASIRRVLGLGLALVVIPAVMAWARGPEDPVQRLAARLDDTGTSVNVMWTILAGFLVFFMQAGFALVETGCIRAKNVAHTMMMNMMVFCIGVLGYWPTGFAFQFGGVNHTYRKPGGHVAAQPNDVRTSETRRGEGRRWSSYASAA